jgi:prolipoprotein diacylglyceryltransferase
MPWGVDFGDGIARHPTQLYEVAALLAIARIITRQSRRPHASGDLFKLFMVSYLGFRLMVDALKPGVSIAFGLTAIQWACVGALAYYARLLQASGAGIPRPDILKPEA